MIDYNHTASLMFGFTSAKCVLLTSAAVLDITHTTLAEVTNSGAWEVYYTTEWPQGGIAVPDVAIEIVDTDDGMVAATNIILTPTATIGPFRYAVIIDQDNKPLGYMNFLTDKYFMEGFTTGIGIPTGYLYRLNK